MSAFQACEHPTVTYACRLGSAFDEMQTGASTPCDPKVTRWRLTSSSVPLTTSSGANDANGANGATAHRRALPSWTRRHSIFRPR